MEWICRIYIPLPRGQEVTHIRHGLRLGLDNEVVNRLLNAVVVSYGQTRPTPRLSPDGKYAVARTGLHFALNRERALRFDGDRFDVLRIPQKEARVHVCRNHISWNAYGDRAAILRERLFYVP